MKKIEKKGRKERTAAQLARENANNRPDFPSAQYGLKHGESGITVIPFVSGTMLKDLREELASYIDTMPEYRSEGSQVTETISSPYEPDTTHFKASTKINPTKFSNDEFYPVEGGFAALANPSSFHNLLVRKIRMAVHVAVVESGVIPIAPDENLEQVIDRLMVRRTKKNPTPEDWHRDEAKFAKVGDTVYGGWLNLDTYRTQYFSVVPYSANQVAGINHGFHPIPQSEHVKLINKSARVAIPPGHILIFNERTIHEVLARPLKNVEKKGHTDAELARCRLFLGWRTTKNTEPITPNLQSRLDAQEALPIKSGQHIHPNPPVGVMKNYPGPPPMFSGMHKINNPMLLKILASHLKSACTELFKYQEGKQFERFPNGLMIPKLFMPSLQELNTIDPSIFMYDDYRTEEREILVPNRVWYNLKRLDGTVVEKLSL